MYGSDIKIHKEQKGFAKGLKYNWIAHANSDFPDTVFINKNEFWFIAGDKRMIRKMRQTISHETIHNILWHEVGVQDMSSHDRCIMKFRDKIMDECPKTYWDYMVF